MAKPELGDGFTRIANEILGALSRTNLSAYETSVLLFIFRNTYGWQRKEDLLALEFIAEGTGIRKQHICRTLGRLRKKKMIVMRKDNRGFSLYGFQKDYEQWAVTWRGNEPYQGITSGGNSVTISGKDVTISGKDVTSLGTQQRKKKDIYKDNHHDKQGALPEKATGREKTIAAYVNMYTPSRPGKEAPYGEYPSQAILDDVDLLAELWGDDVVQSAIQRATEAGKSKVGPSYISAIIRRWHKEGKVEPRMSEREYEHYRETR